MKISDERVREIAGGVVPLVPTAGTHVVTFDEEKVALAREVATLRAERAWIEENTLCVGSCDGPPEVDREAWWLVMTVTDDPPDFAAALRQAMAATEAAADA